MNARQLFNLPVLDAGQIGRDGETRLRSLRAGSEVALPVSASHMRETQPSEGGSGGKAGKVARLAADDKPMKPAALRRRIELLEALVEALKAERTSLFATLSDLLAESVTHKMRNEQAQRILRGEEE